MKLSHLPVPLWSPPGANRWQIRWTRPSGDTGLGMVSYKYRADAEHDAELCRRSTREPCQFDVVPDAGGATLFVPPE